MAVTTFTLPYFGTPPYFSGISSVTDLVPNVFPVAVDGRPYMIDQKSGKFQRGYEQRVRDSTDDSTTPGEGAINPGGLWRRGQDSWHSGAGQTYADMDESAPYRFYKSKGVNPWGKGQLSLLNATKRSLESANTNLFTCVVESGGTQYLYVADGGVVRFSSAPFTYITSTVTNVSASAGTITYTAAAHGFTAGQKVDITGIVPTAYNLSGATIATVATNTFTITNATTGSFVSGGTAVQRPVWTAITTGSPTTLPTTAITGLETNGQNVYIAWTSNDIWYTTPGSTTATFFYPTSGTDDQTYDAFGFAKGRGFAAVNQDLYQIGVGSGSHTIFFDNPDTTFRWAGAAAGQNAVYAAGHAGNKSIIYKITIKQADGALDVPVVSLELPVGEIVTAIHGYLGFIVIGSNKGVRFCSTDAQSNLVAGSLIPTTGAVNDFTSEDRFVWFTYSNYDGTSTGLGRLDLSVFISPNTPAHATDLMYTSTSDVKSVATISGKRIFTISGVGVIVEDTANLVASGEIETGTWRWGIPDRKFIAKVDTRSTPLVGAITSYLKIDDGDYDSVGRWATVSDTENSFNGSDFKTIEAGFKFVLERSSSNTAEGPTFTRWMARAYAAPFRSQVFSVPLLLHKSVTVRGKEYYYDVYGEQAFFDGLIESPRITTLQIGPSIHSVILEDTVWEPADSTGNSWAFDGTLVVTFRSVEN
jgi:hypothetical protein